MPYQLSPELEKLLRERMVAGGYASEDDVIRDALDTLGQFDNADSEIQEEYRQTVAAVREGLADMEAGRMRPLRELIAEAHASAQSTDANKS